MIFEVSILVQDRATRRETLSSPTFMEYSFQNKFGIDIYFYYSLYWLEIRQVSVNATKTVNVESLENNNLKFQVPWEWLNKDSKTLNLFNEIFVVKLNLPGNEDVIFKI